MTKTLASISAELEAAQKDLALWQRLTTAEDRAQALAAAYETARAVADAQAVAKEAADLEASFAGLSNIRVTNESNAVAASGDNILRQLFVVTWDGPQVRYAQRPELHRGSPASGASTACRRTFYAS